MTLLLSLRASSPLACLALLCGRARRLRRRRARLWISTTTIPSPATIPSMASTSPNTRATIDWNAVAEQRRQIRLDQGDRGRRPSRRAIPGQLGGRQSGRHSARRLSLRLLVPPADRGGRPGSSRTCRSKTTRCRRCSTSRRRRLRRPAIAISSAKAAIADMKVMLEEMERHYGKRPVIYTSGRFLRGDPLGRRIHRISDLGALDQAHPGRALWLAALEVLAVPGRRLYPRHRRPRRPQRLLRHAAAMAGVSRRAEVKLNRACALGSA